MNPSGSKLTAYLRKSALTFTTESQRKRAKAAFFSVRTLLWKILGLNGVISQQSQEIDRLKGHSFFLEGKLNLALFGMPNISGYKAYTMSSGTINQLGLRLQKIESAFYLSRPPLPKAIQDWLPTSGVVLSIGYDSEFWKRLISSSADKKVISDWLEEITSQASKDTAAVIISGTPMDAILLQASGALDYLVVLSRFQQLAPLEQFGFLEEGFRALSPKGKCYLVIPSMKHGEEYWADHRNLRPCSKSHVFEIAKVIGFKNSTSNSLDDKFDCLILEK